MTQEPKQFRKPPQRVEPNPEDSTGEGKGPKGPQPPPPMKFSRNLMSWAFVIGILAVFFVVLTSPNGGRPIPSWQAFCFFSQAQEHQTH